jgi:peptidyl-prolyl cis-trans isomerase C
MTASIQRLTMASLMLTAMMAGQYAWAEAKLPDAADARKPAAVQTLAQGQNIVITDLDVQADAQRIPPDVRPLILARPQNVGQMASDLYVFRNMAKMAQQLGMERDPRVAAALQVARDRVLANAWMDALDEKNMPSLEAAEKQARSIYQAQPDRFKVGEEVRARHILISGKDAEARAKAEQVLAQLKSGADFATLAREVSADKGSAARGGDLGFFGRDRMAPEFEKAAFALQKPGDLSTVVETQFGQHIIQLEARRPAGIKPFEEVREGMVKEIRSIAAKDVRSATAEQLRADVKVDNAAVEAFASKNEPKP